MESPQDGRVEAPRKVGRRKEQNAAFTFALQAVKLDEKLCLAPSTGLDARGADFKILFSNIYSNISLWKTYMTLVFE